MTDPIQRYRFTGDPDGLFRYDEAGVFVLAADAERDKAAAVAAAESKSREFVEQSAYLHGQRAERARIRAGVEALPIPLDDDRSMVIDRTNVLAVIDAAPQDGGGHAG